MDPLARRNRNLRRGPALRGGREGQAEGGGHEDQRQCSGNASAGAAHRDCHARGRRGRVCRGKCAPGPLLLLEVDEARGDVAQALCPEE